MTDLKNIGDLFRHQLKSNISGTSLDFLLDRTVFTVYQGNYSISFTFDLGNNLKSFEIKEI